MDESTLTMESFLGALRAIPRPDVPTLPPITKAEVERLESQWPPPRISMAHMASHRQRRVRKKWARRLETARTAEREWGHRVLPRGYFVQNRKLYALRMDAMPNLWDFRALAIDPPEPRRHEWAAPWGLSLTPRAFVMDAV